jgi:hypothetical protein
VTCHFSCLLLLIVSDCSAEPHPCGSQTTNVTIRPPLPPRISLRLHPGPRPAEGPAAWEVLAARIIHHCHTVGDHDGKLADITQQLELVAKQNYDRVSLHPSSPPFPGPGGIPRGMGYDAVQECHPFPRTGRGRRAVRGARRTGPQPGPVG